ncbi:MAG: OmpH family outer membrane protein [Planctomycetes bacterium]|nr:OmpH family outer membrane protein [Planctomycetota bacterium]
MKVSRLYWVVIVGLVALAVGLGRGIADPQPAAPAGTVAVCDLIRTFRDYRRTSDLYKEMEAEQASIVTRQEQHEKQYQQMQQDLRDLRAGSQAYIDQVNAIDAYAIQSRAEVDTAQARLKRIHQQATAEMMRSVEQTVAAVAAEQGYAVVLHRGKINLTEDPAKEFMATHVLYAANAVDITDAVVARLNEQYGKQQSGQE